MTGRGFLAWLVALVLLIFGIPALLFSLIGLLSGSGNVSVALLAVASLAIWAGVMLFRWAMGPWRDKKAAWEQELPEGLSRREKRAAMENLNQRDLRADGIAKLEAKYADLIPELEAAGHYPFVQSKYTVPDSEYGGGWDFYLTCRRCHRRKPALRKSKRLSPDLHCLS